MRTRRKNKQLEEIKSNKDYQEARRAKTIHDVTVKLGGKVTKEELKQLEKESIEIDKEDFNIFKKLSNESPAFRKNLIKCFEKDPGLKAHFMTRWKELKLIP